ncbi:MAG: hypothetical protein GQ564_23155 [Bacteroidales bacterium]|nr:hypothetical protein [Bacteroidales bacterium]
MEFSNGIAIIIGTIIGGSISLIGIYFQQKWHFRRDLIKTAYELALNDFNTVKDNVKKEGGIVAPLESFVTYYIEYLKISTKRNFKISDLSKIRLFRSELNEFYEKEVK